jgi:hypothetical protein
LTPSLSARPVGIATTAPSLGVSVEVGLDQLDGASILFEVQGHATNLATGIFLQAFDVVHELFVEREARSARADAVQGPGADLLIR